MIGKQKHQYIWSEKRSLINAESHIRQYIYERDIWGSNHNYSFIYARDLFAEELHRDEDNKQWVLEGEKLLNKKFARTLLSQGKALRKEFSSFLSTLKPKNLQSLSNDELTKTFLKSCQFHSRLRGLFKTSRQEFLTKAEILLKKILAEKMSDSQKVQKVFQSITSPARLDEVNKEIVDRVKLLFGKTITKGKVYHHLNKYPWLVAHSFNNEEIINNFVTTFKKEMNSLPHLKEEVHKLFDYKKAIEEEQKKILDEYKNKEITYLSWLFGELSLERMRLKGGWSGSDFLYGDLYYEVAKRTGISLEDLFSIYRIDEVVQALKEKKDILNNDEKLARKKAYVLWWNNGKLSFSAGDNAIEIIDRVLEKVEEGNDLKGQVACKGYYEGLVCLIFPGDLEMLKRAGEKFKKGSVLVTTMTQPNMVPLMKIAGAIVTDEGGLTSHAAIIARELKVPCIVGTKIGTKMLRDGDFVEVNADEGLVRVINRAVL
jgi:phosphohistidine swiveling domain-containing protein